MENLQPKPQEAEIKTVQTPEETEAEKVKILAAEGVPDGAKTVNFEELAGFKFIKVESIHHRQVSDSATHAEVLSSWVLVPKDFDETVAKGTEEAISATRASVGEKIAEDWSTDELESVWVESVVEKQIDDERIERKLKWVRELAPKGLF